MAFVKIPESTIQVKLVELTDNCIDKIADAVVRELTNRKTENCSERPNNCEWSADERCIGCNHYKLTCDLFSEICHYEPKDEPQTEQPCDGCEYSKPYIEYKCTHHSCKFEDEPLTADYCDTCDHKGCEYCIADSSNPYCVPSNYHKVEDEPTVDYKL